MNNEFIFCSSCGTRNFIEDKICGVCGKILYSQPSSKSDVDKPKSHKNFIVIVLAIAFFCIYLL